MRLGLGFERSLFIVVRIRFRFQLFLLLHFYEQNKGKITIGISWITSSKSRSLVANLQEEGTGYSCEVHQPMKVASP
jgi:hypothetical protein